MNPLLIRRRGMMLQQREPLVLLYEASNVTTTTDTNIKLFDPAISFTILVDATWNHYNTVTGASGVVGLTANSLKFRIGGISNGNTYSDNILVSTGNRYAAAMLNEDNAYRRCMSLNARGTNTATRKKHAISYDKSTRVFRAIGEGLQTANGYYILDYDMSSAESVQLFVGGQTGTIHNVKIYQGAMTYQEMINWYENT